MSVRSNDLLQMCNVSALEIQWALKNFLKYSKHDLKIIKNSIYNAYKQLKIIKKSIYNAYKQLKNYDRRRIAKRKNFKSFLMQCRRTSDSADDDDDDDDDRNGESGADGSDSSISDDSRSTILPFTARHIPRGRAKLSNSVGGMKMNLDIITEQMRDNENYRDCTARMKQSTLRRSLSRNRTLDHSLVPRQNLQTITHDSRNAQLSEIAPISMKDRFDSRNSQLSENTHISANNRYVKDSLYQRFNKNVPNQHNITQYDSRNAQLTEKQNDQFREPQNGSISLKGRFAKNTSTLLPCQRFNENTFKVSYTQKPTIVHQVQSTNVNTYDEDLLPQASSTVNLTSSDANSLQQKRVPANNRYDDDDEIFSQSISTRFNINTIKQKRILDNGASSETKKAKLLTLPENKMKYALPKRGTMTKLVTNNNTQTATNHEKKVATSEQITHKQTTETQSETVNNNTLANQDIINDSNYLDLIHKIVPPEQIKNQNANTKETSKNIQEKQDKWDVSMALSTCDDPKSDTVEDIFNMPQENDRVKQIKKVTGKDLKEDTLQSHQIESNCKVTTNNNDINFKKPSGLTMESALRALEIFWDTDFSDDEDIVTSFAARTVQRDQQENKENENESPNRSTGNTCNKNNSDANGVTKNVKIFWDTDISDDEDIVTSFAARTVQRDQQENKENENESPNRSTGNTCNKNNSDANGVTKNDKTFWDTDISDDEDIVTSFAARTVQRDQQENKENENESPNRSTGNTCNKNNSDANGVTKNDKTFWDTDISDDEDIVTSFAARTVQRDQQENKENENESPNRSTGNTCNKNNSDANGVPKNDIDNKATKNNRKNKREMPEAVNTKRTKYIIQPQSVFNTSRESLRIKEEKQSSQSRLPDKNHNIESPRRNLRIKQKKLSNSFTKKPI